MEEPGKLTSAAVRPKDQVDTLGSLVGLIQNGFIVALRSPQAPLDREMQILLGVRLIECD